MKVVVGFVGAVLVVGSLSCSEAPAPVETVEEKPKVESPKFVVVGSNTNKPAPRAVEPTTSAPPTTTDLPVASSADTSSSDSKEPPEIRALRNGLFEGRQVAMPTFADGHPVNTLAGTNPRTVMLVHPGTSTHTAFTLEDFGRSKRIVLGSTQVVTAARWQPGMDLYLSPKQMFEAFPPTPTPARAPAIDTRSVTLTRPDAVVPLPGEVFDVSVGGKYLLLSLREPNRIVVFSVAQKKIAATFPADDDLLKVAGCADRLCVLLPTKKKVQSYAFFDMSELHGAVGGKVIPFHEKSQVVAMGRKSPGPLMIHDAEGLGFSSIDRTDERTVPENKYGMKFSSRDPRRLSARDDGSAFYLGTDEGPVREFRFYKESSGSSSYYQRDLEESLIAAKQGVLSRTDGSGLYVYGDRELCFRNGLRVGNRSRYDHIVPCSPPGFWLAAGAASAAESVIGIELFFGFDPQPLETVYVAEGGKLADDAKRLPLRDRIVHFPEQKKLAIVTSGPPQVLLLSLDPEERFEAAQRPTLMVTSTPPLPFFSYDQKLEYQIQVAAMPDSVRFELIKGPPQLTVSKEGLVEWKPDSKFRVFDPELSYGLIKIMASNGKQVYERLDLTIRRPQAFMSR